MITVALLHWPCLDKNGEEIATAITNLDLHDLARVCLTYGINTLYIVHPNDAQLGFAGKIMDHWLQGYGGEYNPLRKRAFEAIQLVKDLEDVKRRTGARMVGTSAKGTEGCISWSDARKLASDTDVCLVFGTGWGLAPRLLRSLDATIEPIDTGTGFNHLSVRSAVSIAIDRIVGR
ncbi:MAG TPA: RNA methyltransferase [Deltaproteobacteria bacterium]|nr:RNA methyltransferase [Deltaproteobacteria bacterium]HOI08498.1 RNA methyltransferase [Deltaproteobacteria bacterium]